MKKFLTVLLALASLIMIGCTSCQPENTTDSIYTDTIIIPTQDTIITYTDIEHIVALDREFVWANIGEEYKYYETNIRFLNYIDDKPEFVIDEVSNVFQKEEFGIKSNHYKGETEYRYFHALWVGDFDLSEENVKISFEEAYKLVLESGLELPHTKYCVLRREIGPIPDINPQYIFGNFERQVYVDAVEGKVTDCNPAFPE